MQAEVDSGGLMLWMITQPTEFWKEITYVGALASCASCMVLLDLFNKTQGQHQVITSVWEKYFLLLRRNYLKLQCLTYLKKKII